MKRTAFISGALLCLGLAAPAAPPRFACTPPVGWQTLGLRHAPPTLRLLASPPGGDAATFSVQDVSSVLPPERYVQTLLTALRTSAPQTRLFRRGPFVTTSGLRGYCAAFDETSPGGSTHFIVCVFPILGQRRLLAAGIWPASDTAKYQAAVDRALKTFTLLH